MKFFIDSANLDEIRSAAEMGIVCGVTTNPSLIAKEGRDYVQTLKEICEIVDGPISGEVSPFSTTAEEMVKEGREIAAMHPNMVVKIPMTAEGLKAIRVLNSEGIKTNCTLIFSANQALLAALAGADIATVPYKALVQCLRHPLTEEGLRKFENDYAAVFGRPNA